MRIVGDVLERGMVCVSDRVSALHLAFRYGLSGIGWGVVVATGVSGCGGGSAAIAGRHSERVVVRIGRHKVSGRDNRTMDIDIRWESIQGNTVDS